MENNQYKTSAFLKELKSKPMISSVVPMAYIPGYPYLEERNKTLCISVPFLRYQVTGKVDKTRVFPIRYVATFALPNLNLVELVDLKYTAPFVEVDFNRPCGYFRHEAVKDLDRNQYQEARKQLMEEYDSYIETKLSNDKVYTNEEFEIFRSHLQRLLEPSLKPFYKVLNGQFYDDFLK